MSRAPRRIVVTGTTVVTMDEPKVVHGDLLIEDGVIAQVGGTVERSVSDDVVDGTDLIVAPGFVDTHRHCWQTQFRRHIPDVDDVASYLIATHRSLALHYEPEDMYVGSYLGALGALDSGITSLVDFSHNSRSGEHCDAAIAGLAASGIRASYACGPPLSGEWDQQWPGDLERIVREHPATPETLLTVRMAIQGSGDFGGSHTEVTPELVELARGLGLHVSVDGVIGGVASTNVERLAASGALGPDVTLIHCQAITDHAWDLIAATGAGVSLTVTSDAQIGIGSAVAPVRQCLERNILPSLSVDVETALPGDMFTQMRALLSIQRMWELASPNPSGQVRRIGVEDAIRFGTLGGAIANGQGAVTGSVTVGKQADLILIDTNVISVFPVNDPTGLVVSGIDSAAVTAVLVGGVFRKRGGQLVGVDVAAVRTRAEASRDRLLAATS